MKKIKTISLLLALLLLIGCTPTDQPIATEKPESPVVEKTSQEVQEEVVLEDLEYLLPEFKEEFDAIDEMPREEAAKIFADYRKSGTLGQLGSVYYLNDLVNEGLAEAREVTRNTRIRKLEMGRIS